MDERRCRSSRPLADEAWGPGHPVIGWARREILPPLRHTLKPARVIVFDPPDRPASVGAHPPGLLVVASSFCGIPVAERRALVIALLAAASPVRPLCLTPEEFEVAATAPGPVIAAARSGVRIL